MKPSDPLAYAPGLEHHHLTMSTLGGHGLQLERWSWDTIVGKLW